MNVINFIMLIFLAWNSAFTPIDSSEVEFRFKSSTAKAVFVAGNFNNWYSHSQPLTKNNNIWKLTLTLPSGYCYYKFIVDGKWISDPDNAWKMNDSRGGLNSILKVGEPPRPYRQKNEKPFPKEKLPKPILEENPEYVDLYYAAWETAWNKIAEGKVKNGFSKQYMDEGFNELIYQWDTCFMVAYGIYARHIFPVMPSLDNFYRKQRADGHIQRVYNETTGNPVTEPTKQEPMVNPPLFAWIELRYYHITGDNSRLRRVLPKLVNYSNWIENHCKSTTNNGLYYTTALGSGMDNCPRSDIGQGGWIDFSAQQALAAKSISEIAKILNDEKIETEFITTYHQLSDSINTLCWNEDQKFYFDLTQDDTLCHTKHIGAFWTLLAEIVEKNRDQLVVSHLLNPKEFWRPHLIPSLSADDPNYDESGYYWRGSVWAPTNYMVIKGLEKYGYVDLADEIALNHVKNIEYIYTFFEPDEEKIPFEERYGDAYHTIWECYSAELQEPATRWDNTFYSRQDFVGWSGLGPIAMLIENILGFTIDGQNNTILWRIHRQDRHGIENIQLRDQFVSLICVSQIDKLEINVTAEKPFMLKIEWKAKQYEKEIIQKGRTEFEIRL